MEWWNNGTLVLKGSFSFLIVSSLIVKKKIPNNPKSHFSRTQYSIIPLFHYSNWGGAPKFNV